MRPQRNTSGGNHPSRSRFGSCPPSPTAGPRGGGGGPKRPGGGWPGHAPPRNFRPAFLAVPEVGREPGGGKGGGGTAGGERGGEGAVRPTASRRALRTQPRVWPFKTKGRGGGEVGRGARTATSRLAPPPPPPPLPRCDLPGARPAAGPLLKAPPRAQRNLPPPPAQNRAPHLFPPPRSQNGPHRTPGPAPGRRPEKAPSGPGGTYRSRAELPRGARAAPLRSGGRWRWPHRPPPARPGRTHFAARLLAVHRRAARAPGGAGRGGWGRAAPTGGEGRGRAEVRPHRTPSPNTGAPPKVTSAAAAANGRLPARPRYRGNGCGVWGWGRPTRDTPQKRWEAAAGPSRGSGASNRGWQRYKPRQKQRGAPLPGWGRGSRSPRGAAALLGAEARRPGRFGRDLQLGSGGRCGPRPRSVPKGWDGFVPQPLVGQGTRATCPSIALLNVCPLTYPAQPNPLLPRTAYIPISPSLHATLHATLSHPPPYPPTTHPYSYPIHPPSLPPPSSPSSHTSIIHSPINPSTCLPHTPLIPQPFNLTITLPTTHVTPSHSPVPLFKHPHAHPHTQHYPRSGQS